jgi:hypothetical protein
MTPEEVWADIERVEVDANAILKYDREIQFYVLGFNLCREVTSWTCVAACVIPPTGGWSRDGAVLAGHAVRLFKLLRSLRDQVNGERADLMWVVLRMASECAINLRVLIRDGETGAIDDYVRYSLQREWMLLAEIDANIAQRGGDELPIEGRMNRSIMRAFEQSEVDPLSRPAIRIRHWGGMDLRKRAASLGLEKAYLAVFSGPSESVHGNWGDLLRHHLKWNERGFEPNTDSSPMTRPEPFYAVAVIAARAVVDYLRHLDSRTFDHAIERLDDLIGRVELADALHEQYLQGRSNPPLQPTSGG